MVLETPSGSTTIQGRTAMSTFWSIEGDAELVIQQAIARYTWDGESAHGMIERSTRADRVTRPAR